MQGALPFPVEHTVIFRTRPDGRIEVRWPEMEVYATFRSWRVALDMLPYYETVSSVGFMDASVRVRV